MRWMPSQVELYEQMSLLSSSMVAAVRARDWDRLTELERDASCLRDTLTAAPDDSESLAADLARKHSLIQRILDDDAEVRRHTEPWMERICEFLGAGRRHDAPQACGSEAGEASPGGA